jgi:hypothetical protein
MQMDIPSNYIFICFKDHKGNIIILIVIICLEYFSLIAKFTCSKFDTNKKCFGMFKTLKPRKSMVLVFFKHLIFLPNVHHSFWKLKNILTLMVRRAKGLELTKIVFITNLNTFGSNVLWPWKLWILKMWL